MRSKQAKIYEGKQLSSEAIREAAKALMPSVELGHVVMTRAVADTIRREEVTDCLFKHSRGRWGGVCSEDAKQNDKALTTGERLVSRHEVTTLDGEKVKALIITEYDRSLTTVLLPADYHDRSLATVLLPAEY